MIKGGFFKHKSADFKIFNFNFKMSWFCSCMINTHYINLKTLKPLTAVQNITNLSLHSIATIAFLTISKVKLQYDPQCENS